MAYLTQDEWTSTVGVTMCRPQHGAGVATGRLLVGGRLAGRFELAVPALEPFTFPVERDGQVLLGRRRDDPGAGL